MIIFEQLIDEAIDYLKSQDNYSAKDEYTAVITIPKSHLYYEIICANLANKQYESIDGYKYKTPESIGPVKLDFETYFFERGNIKCNVIITDDKKIKDVTLIIVPSDKPHFMPFSLDDINPQ